MPSVYPFAAVCICVCAAPGAADGPPTTYFAHLKSGRTSIGGVLNYAQHKAGASPHFGIVEFEYAGVRYAGLWAFSGLERRQRVMIDYGDRYSWGSTKIVDLPWFRPGEEPGV